MNAKYNKHIKPAKKRIEAIIHDQSAFLPPRSVLAAYNDIKLAGERIVLIQKRMTKTVDYITMLSQGKKDDATNNMILKQNEYYKYFFNYYDHYCSLYLDMRFRFYMTIIRDELIAAKKISGINVKHLIDTIKTDIKCIGYILKSKYYLPRRSGTGNYLSGHSERGFLAAIGGFEIITDIEGTMAAFFNDDNTDKRSKKQAAEKSENEEKYDMVLEKTNASIKAIEEKIQAAAAYLITIQTNKNIGGTSPIDEENALNIQINEDSFNTIIEYSKTLNDEYDRFMAEVELSENFKAAFPKKD
ncbi:MAG: hypothetical protein LBB83_00115 [Treponema sp.]|nr:hypothetical protein [Treponema sp.]